MYQRFLKVDGSHPWREVSPEGFVDYPVRYRSGGEVLYFNFDLAREIGLIPKSHPNKLNSELENIILKTFSLQILNEHDWENRKSFPKDGYEDRLYMATRYLQTQHENKQGRTSGDGRSMWNGSITYRGRTFDVSSCGTGNTILSPGAQEAERPLPTGDKEFGYASGLADLDEMLAGAIMSEIFFKEGYPSERCLTVIAFKDKTAIGVRTAPNLVRPAHMFRYLKLGMWKETKDSMDFFLQRQENNGTWDLPKTPEARYRKALDYFARTYAKLSAVMEEEYIFNWLSWDGDNILASGGILDYGSIRQFAARHDKYRYEDVDRFSTSLTEQRYWAKKMIQTFVQLVDFIVTKDKKNMDLFVDDSCLMVFDKQFLKERQARMLWRVGFSPKQIERLQSDHQETIQAFRKVLNYFEQMKTQEGIQEVPDGIDHPPVFLVRNIFRELPEFILNNYKPRVWPIMEPLDFCLEMAATYVDKEDLVINDYRKTKSEEFQNLYQDLIRAAGQSPLKTLSTVAERSAVVNYQHRKTGDGLTWIVNEAVKASKKMDQHDLQQTIERFIQSQVLIPGKWKPIHPRELSGKSLKSALLRKMQENLELYSETI